MSPSISKFQPTVIAGGHVLPSRGESVALRSIIARLRSGQEPLGARRDIAENVLRALRRSLPDPMGRLETIGGLLQSGSSTQEAALLELAALLEVRGPLGIERLWQPLHFKRTIRSATEGQTLRDYLGQFRWMGLDRVEGRFREAVGVTSATAEGWGRRKRAESKEHHPDDPETVRRLYDFLVGKHLRADEEVPDPMDLLRLIYARRVDRFFENHAEGDPYTLMVRVPGVCAELPYRDWTYAAFLNALTQEVSPTQMLAGIQKVHAKVITPGTLRSHRKGKVEPTASRPETADTIDLALGRYGSSTRAFLWFKDFVEHYCRVTTEDGAVFLPLQEGRSRYSIRLQIDREYNAREFDGARFDLDPEIFPYRYLECELDPFSELIRELDARLSHAPNLPLNFSSLVDLKIQLGKAREKHSEILVLFKRYQEDRKSCGISAPQRIQEACRSLLRLARAIKEQTGAREEVFLGKTTIGYRIATETPRYSCPHEVTFEERTIVLPPLCPLLLQEAVSQEGRCDSSLFNDLLYAHLLYSQLKADGIVTFEDLPALIHSFFPNKEDTGKIVRAYQHFVSLSQAYRDAPLLDPVREEIRVLYQIWDRPRSEAHQANFTGLASASPTPAGTVTSVSAFQSSSIGGKGDVGPMLKSRASLFVLHFLDRSSSIKMLPPTIDKKEAAAALLVAANHSTPEIFADRESDEKKIRETIIATLASRRRYLEGPKPTREECESLNFLAISFVNHLRLLVRKEKEARSPEFCAVLTALSMNSAGDLVDVDRIVRKASTASNPSRIVCSVVDWLARRRIESVRQLDDFLVLIDLFQMEEGSDGSNWRDRLHASAKIYCPDVVGNEPSFGRMVERLIWGVVVFSDQPERGLEIDRALEKLEFLQQTPGPRTNSTGNRNNGDESAIITAAIATAESKKTEKRGSTTPAKLPERTFKPENFILPVARSGLSQMLTDLETLVSRERRRDWVLVRYTDETGGPRFLATTEKEYEAVLEDVSGAEGLTAHLAGIVVDMGFTTSTPLDSAMAAFFLSLPEWMRSPSGSEVERDDLLVFISLWLCNLFFSPEQIKDGFELTAEAFQKRERDPVGWRLAINHFLEAHGKEARRIMILFHNLGSALYSWSVVRKEIEMVLNENLLLNHSIWASFFFKFHRVADCVDRVPFSEEQARVVRGHIQRMAGTDDEDLIRKIAVDVIQAMGAAYPRAHERLLLDWQDRLRNQPDLMKSVKGCPELFSISLPPFLAELRQAYQEIESNPNATADDPFEALRRSIFHILDEPALAPAAAALVLLTAARFDTTAYRLSHLADMLREAFSQPEDKDRINRVVIRYYLRYRREVLFRIFESRGEERYWWVSHVIQCPSGSPFRIAKMHPELSSVTFSDIDALGHYISSVGGQIGTAQRQILLNYIISDESEECRPVLAALFLLWQKKRFLVGSTKYGKTQELWDAVAGIVGRNSGDMRRQEILKLYSRITGLLAATGQEK